MSTIKSSQITRSTVIDTWRWLWPDVLMRIIPLGVIPFLYIAIFHLPFSFLGLTLHNWPQQLVIGLVVGIVMTCFASAYRMYVVGPFFRRPTVGDHLLQGFYYLIINGPVEELFFRGVLYTFFRERWGAWIAALVSSLAFAIIHFDILVAAMAFFLGLFCALGYERSRSLWVSVTIHVLSNTIKLIFVYMTLSSSIRIPLF